MLESGKRGGPPVDEHRVGLVLQDNISKQEDACARDTHNSSQVRTAVCANRQAPSCKGRPLISCPAASFLLCNTPLTACSNPVPWVPGGGWGDCDPSFPVFAADVPNAGSAVPVTVQLPPNLISSWLVFRGTQNFGLLLR